MSILAGTLAALLTFSPAGEAATEPSTRHDVGAYAWEEVVERRVVTFDGVQFFVDRFIWCPGSHPWVKQTVQAPSRAYAEDDSWVNVFPGLNAKTSPKIHVRSASLPTGYGQWGVRVTMDAERNSITWVPAPGIAELHLHCTNDPAYNPYALKVTGTPPPMPPWGTYDYQLTLTGPGNPRVDVAKVTGLPPGLTITETGRITGTLNWPQYDDHTITVPIRSDYIAIRPGDAQIALPGAPLPSS